MITPTQKSLAVAAFSLAIFGLAIWVLSEALGNLKWSDVGAYFASLSPLRIVVALGFVCGSYFWLSWYDTLAVRFVTGRPFAWREIVVTSFTAFAFGHNLGASTLSGGAIRLRDYSRMGLGASQVAAVIALLVFALGMGSNVLLQYAAFFHTEATAKVLRVSPLAAQLMGVMGMAFLLGYLWLTARRQGAALPLSTAVSIPTPTLSFSLRQMAVSVADLSCSAAAFYCLLPIEVSYLTFLGFYVLAMVAGLISNVPGGLGVFESVLLLTLPSAAPAQLAGAALAFRALYFLLPFALALALMALQSGWRWRRQRLARLRASG